MSMDYHFTLPNESDESSHSSNSSLKLGKLVKRLTPLFLLAAILPLFLFFISSPADVKFLTRASRESELRIWFEPSQIVSRTNSPIELKVFANFESESLMPGVELVAQSDDLQVQGEVTYLKPFNGQIEIGTVSVMTGSEIGIFEVQIPSELVSPTAFEGELDIITSSATIRVQ